MTISPRIPSSVLRNRRSVADYLSLLDSMADVLDAGALAERKDAVRRAWLNKAAAQGHPAQVPYWSGKHGVEATDDCGDWYIESNSTCRMYHKRILREW